MPAFVTGNAKRNEIFPRIVAELTPGVQMMDFQHLCGTAILASPSIPVQDLNFERFVALRIQPYSGLFLSQSLHLHLVE